MYCGAYSQSAYKVQASLGRHGEDCAGRGICSFSVAETPGENIFKSIIAKDSVLTIQLDISLLTGNDLLKVAGAETIVSNKTYYFIHEKTYTINESDKSILKLSNAYNSIPPQTVPIKINGTTAEIVLTLKK